jgi:hypothetical protein
MSPHTAIGTFFVWAVLVSCAAGQDSLAPALPAAEDTTPGASFDTITGQLGESVKKKERPYLVTGDIEVSPGATVVIEPGTIFLFKNFTTLHIHGTLLARGTKEQPIVFTSENDTAYNPHPSLAPAAYDWNGITVYESGNGACFRNCSINYSLYGINSLTKSITVETCSFIQNGKSDLTVEGNKYQNLTSDFAFNASAPDTSVKPPPAITKKSEPAPVVTRKQEPAPAARPPAPAAAPPRKSNLRFVLRYSGLSLFGAGAALFIWQTLEYSRAAAEFDRLSDTSNPANTVNNPNIDADWQAAKNRKNNSLTTMITGGAAALLGAAGFGISFLF